MTSTDFSNLIRKLSALDSQACQEAAVTAVKQAGVMVQSQARLLISSDTGALARSVKVKNEVKENKATATVYTNSAYAPTMNLELALMEKPIIRVFLLKFHQNIKKLVG